MKNAIIDTKKKINRATSVIFIVQLFGALGAGFFFVIQNLFGVEHILGALEPQNENILWFILFWATDFFYIAFTLILSYTIAGLPAVAPALALSVYFAHFAGTPVSGEDMYFAYFATPANGGGGVNIGYMGYLIMALVLSLLIKYLFAGYDHLKRVWGRGIDRKLDKMRAKNRKVPKDLTGLAILDNIDLIVLILILPVASAALTWLLIRYGIQIPFAALGEALAAPLQSLSGFSVILTGIVFGLMIGFDLIGPVSMAAFGVAVAAFLDGNAQLMTIYGACFITIGWIPLGAVILQKITKKGGSCDTDDFNLAVSGPINAFFENVKLTVAFSMPYAYRSPFTVIPGYMIGSAFTGLITALCGIVNTDYLNTLPKYGNGATFEQLFTQGEYYISFTLPLRSGDWLTCRIPLFFIILLGAVVGGAAILLFKELAARGAKKRGTYVESNGDIVIEIRQLARHYLAEIRNDKQDNKSNGKEEHPL